MKTLKTWIVFVIIILSLFLRLHNYAVYPQRGATSDEYAFSFLGISLLTQHKPVSWSYFNAYKNRKGLVLNKIYFPIVEPFFDHPPLYGLVIGAWAMLFGENTFQKIDLQVIRLVPMMLSVVSSFFVFLISEKLYGNKTGFWALLIFSVTTVFVINMRVVVAENILTTFFLAGDYLFLRWKHTMSAKKALLLGMICGLAFLSKILGIAAVLYTLYFFIESKQKRKYVSLFVFGFLICAAMLTIYVLYFGKDLFLQIQFAQSLRNIGPKEFWYIITTPIIVNYTFQDPWYLFGFFSLFFSFFDYAKNKFVIIPVFTYLLLTILSLTEEGQSGWYLIPFFPFLSMAIAHLLVESFKKISLMPLVFFLFMGLSQYHLLFESNFGESIGVYRIFVLILIIPVIVSVLFKSEFLYKFYCNLWFYLFIAVTAYITYHYIHPA